MKIKPIKKEYMQVLERIQRSIPQELLNRVTKKEQVAPKQARMIRAMASGGESDDIDMSKVSPKDREYAQTLIDSGFVRDNLEKEVEVEDKMVAREIDAYVEAEVLKATERGELPKGKKFRNLKKKIKHGKS